MSVCQLFQPVVIQAGSCCPITENYGPCLGTPGLAVSDSIFRPLEESCHIT